VNPKPSLPQCLVLHDKWCPDCKEVRSRTDFYKNRSQPDGLGGHCKNCHRRRVYESRASNPGLRVAESRTYYEKNKAACNERNRQWAARNPEKKKEDARRWALENPDRRRDASRKWSTANPEKRKEIVRQSFLRRNYCIDPQLYDKLLAAQGGGCAICGRLRANEKHFAIDHDHSCCPGIKSCGKCIRGILCPLCNRSLGQFGDNVDGLLKVLKYLENPPWGELRES
jgi:hypothetical protein